MPPEVIAAAAIQYKQLAHSRNIRLVRLHPLSSLSAVRCDLFECDSEASPEYDALSYEWGPSSADVSIIYINGAATHVRRNLFDALTVLAGEMEQSSRLLWIDMLCINQADLAERNDQVKMMGRIYSKANIVIAWTGTADRGDEFAMLGLRMVLNNEVPLLDSAVGIQHVYVQDFAKWCTRSYWSRLWIVQEVFLARKIVVYTGPKSVDWHEVLEALSLSPMQGMDVFIVSGSKLVEVAACCMGFPDASSFSLSNYNGGFRKPNDKIHPDVGEAHDIPPLVRHMRDRSLKLKNLIYRFHSWLCKDPRDKVYAVLGIAQDAADINVDYRKSMSEIFADVVHLYRDDVDLVSICTGLQSCLFPNELPEPTARDGELIWLRAMFDRKLAALDVLQENVDPLDMIRSPFMSQCHPRAIKSGHSDHSKIQMPWRPIVTDPKPLAAILPCKDGSSLMIPVPIDDLSVSHGSAMPEAGTPYPGHTMIGLGWSPDQAASPGWQTMAYGPPGVQPGDFPIRFYDSELAILARLSEDGILRLLGRIHLLNAGDFPPLRDELRPWYLPDGVPWVRPAEEVEQDLATIWLGNPHEQYLSELRFGNNAALWLRLDYRTLLEVASAAEALPRGELRTTLVQAAGHGLRLDQRQVDRPLPKFPGKASEYEDAVHPVPYKELVHTRRFSSDVVECQDWHRFMSPIETPRLS
ncbi:hypothetical protein LTR17_010442 [Elasticomyces elasticus]|nr:hypothetical protein LTR17_010442 [Elasticomyces elasticus]